MSSSSTFYAAIYGNLTAPCLRQVRAETYGQDGDIGQNGWLTVDELSRFCGWLGLDAGSEVLDVGSGSGGPALHVAREIGCRVTGVDRNEHGVQAAGELARREGLGGQACFFAADASKTLRFDAGTFTAVMCIDAMSHLPGRLHVLGDWYRLLAPGGRILYTDPVVITGLISGEETALRSAAGYTEFAPPGEDERLIAEAGFTLIRREDATANIAMVSGRWHAARARYRAGLSRIEGEPEFGEMQAGLAAVHRLSSERRLSRIVFVGEKRQ